MVTAERDAAWATAGTAMRTETPAMPRSSARDGSDRWSGRVGRVRAVVLIVRPPLYGGSRHMKRTLPGRWLPSRTPDLAWVLLPFRSLKLGPSERLSPCQCPTQLSFAHERLRSRDLTGLSPRSIHKIPPRPCRSPSLTASKRSWHFIPTARDLLLFEVDPRRSAPSVVEKGLKAVP